MAPGMNVRLSVGVLLMSLVLGMVPRTEAADDVEVDENKLDYAKGSVCGYCEYCKFCTLCDEQCPCEASQSRPACHMCKYCTYCKMCGICDTICQPGGFIDSVSAAIVNAMPSFDSADVDSDIAGVRHHIEKKSRELEPEIAPKNKDEL